MQKIKDSIIKYSGLDIQSGDYVKNPKFIRKDKIPIKVISLQNSLKKTSLNVYDWMDCSKSDSKSFYHRADMDAKINHRKKRVGD